MLTIFKVIGAASLLMVALSATASAAVVNFGPPNSMDQSFGINPIRDTALAFSNQSDPVPDLVMSRGTFGSSSVQSRTSDVFGEYRFAPVLGTVSIQDISTAGAPYGLDVADATVDGNPDIVVAYDGGVAISRGVGDGSYTAMATVSGSLPELHSDVKLALINNDLIPDLVAVRSTGLDAFMNSGSAVTPFATRTTYAGLSGGNGLAVADFDGDGLRDAGTTTTSDNRAVVQIANGANLFQTSRSIGLFSRPGAVTAANVSGDSKPELIVTEPDRGTVAVISTGSLPNVLGPITRIETGYSPVDVETADLDGNGVLEIITANAADNSVTVAEVGGDSKTFPAGPNPTTVSVGHMSTDSALDLLTTNDGAFTVSTLINLGLPAAPPPTPTPPAAERRAAITCSYKNVKKSLPQVTCNARLSNPADAKDLGATLLRGKRKVASAKAKPGKRLTFKLKRRLIAGKYSVKLTVTNFDGSKISASRTLRVK